MKLRRFWGLQRELREPLKEEGTSKINIYKLIVPSVPSVPSILPSACERTKIYHINSLQKSLSLGKLEGTKGTKGTESLQISFFRFPLHDKSSLWFPSHQFWRFPYE